MKRINVLITGSHRSGTTWPAKVIGAHPEVNYIAEPFNPSFFHPGNPARFWFEFLEPGKEYPSWKRYMNSRLNPSWYGCVNELPLLFRKGHTGAFFRKQWRKMFRSCQLIKDPIAVFSAPWLARNFNMKVILMIRHPAAFVSSLKLKGWRFDFNEFLKQPVMMKEVLEPYAGQVLTYVSEPRDLIYQGILLWNIIYHTVRGYRDQEKTWYFLRHEDISSNPVSGFKNLLSYIGLDDHKSVQEAIRLTSGKNNENSEWASLGDSINRHSAGNIVSWKKRLTDEEAERIKVGTLDVWKDFYTEKEW